MIMSLLIGEVHPFSREPMYNSFPNLATAFYLSDSRLNSIHPEIRYTTYGLNTFGWK